MKGAEGVWKGVYPLVFGHSKQLSLNKFFDPNTASMRKGRDGGKKKRGKKKKKKKREKKEKRRMKIVATNSLPAVDSLTIYFVGLTIYTHISILTFLFIFI